MSLHALIVLSNLFLLVHSYKILALFPHPGKSHVDVFLPLTKALARKGHEVTVISHFPLKTPQINYTDVSLGNGSNHLINIFDMDNNTKTRWDKWSIIQLLEEFRERSCRIGFESAHLRDFLKANQTFDVVIAEFFNSDCFAGFINKFKAPLIGISSCTIMHWTNERFANPTHPAYIPNNLMDFSDQMTFFQRVENLLVGIFHQIYFTKIMTKNDKTLVKKYLDSETLKLKNIIFNASLLLVNTHFSLNLPRPLVPAVIEVGGIHIDKPKTLTKVSKINSHRYISKK